MAGRSLKETLEIMATVAVIVASVAVTWSVVTGRRAVTADVRAIPRPVAESVVGLSIDVGLGDEGVPPRVTGPGLAIVEFSDFECPYCARHSRETLPMLRRDYVDTGKVAYLFMHFPLEDIHPNSFAAAKAATCATRQLRFWEMHSWLFRNQVSLGAIDLNEPAKELGMDGVAYGKCFDDSERNVRNDLAQGRRLGVNSTPTFFFGEVRNDRIIELSRRISGAAPYELFKRTSWRAWRQGGPVVTGRSIASSGDTRRPTHDSSST